MRINSYGRTATVMSTMQNLAIRKTAKSNFRSVMELEQMPMAKDSASHSKNHEIDYQKLVDAIIKSGDLKS